MFGMVSRVVPYAMAIVLLCFQCDDFLVFENAFMSVSSSLFSIQFVSSGCKLFECVKVKYCGKHMTYN